MPYQNGYNLSSSGNAQSDSGFVTTGFIPLPGNVTKLHLPHRRVRDRVLEGGKRVCPRWMVATAHFQPLKTVIPANKHRRQCVFPEQHLPESTTAMTFQVTEAASNVPASAAYFRVSAMGKGRES